MTALYRMSEKCADCPFAKSGPGLHLRKSLHPRRWPSILADLRAGKHFTCHKTTEETGNNTNLVCAGAIEWQDKHGRVSTMVQIMRRLLDRGLRPVVK